MTAPGIIASAMQNVFYDTEDAYLAALGAALQVEFRTGLMAVERGKAVVILSRYERFTVAAAHFAAGSIPSFHIFNLIAGTSLKIDCLKLRTRPNYWICRIIRKTVANMLEAEFAVTDVACL